MWMIFKCERINQNNWRKKKRRKPNIWTLCWSEEILTGNGIYGLSNGISTGFFFEYIQKLNECQK